MSKNRTLPIPSYVIAYGVIGMIGTIVLGVIALLVQLIGWLFTEPYWDNLSITLVAVAFAMALLLSLSWIALDAAVGMALYLLLSTEALVRWLAFLRHKQMQPLRWLCRTQIAVIEWLLEGQVRPGPNTY